MSILVNEIINQFDIWSTLGYNIDAPRTGAKTPQKTPKPNRVTGMPPSRLVRASRSPEASQNIVYVLPELSNVPGSDFQVLILRLPVIFFRFLQSEDEDKN
jgi:hypothetical protein